MSDEANDNLNIVSSNVVRPTLGKLGEKTSNGTVAPIVEPKFSDPKSRFLDNLYKQNWNDLCGWLYRRYGSGPPEPEDIAQTAFMKISGVKEYQKIKNPRAFLFTTAVNTALTSIDWVGRTRKFVDVQLQEVGKNVEQITPERVYSEKQRVRVVSDILATLPEKQREIIVRSRFKGQTYDQIKVETGWSRADISRQMTLAMAALRGGLDAMEKNDK